MKNTSDLLGNPTMNDYNDYEELINLEHKTGMLAGKPVEPNEFEIEKGRVAYHEHDGYSEHPVSVKHHQEYFSQHLSPSELRGAYAAFKLLGRGNLNPQEKQFVERTLGDKTQWELDKLKDYFSGQYQRQRESVASPAQQITDKPSQTIEQTPHEEQNPQGEKIANLGRLWSYLSHDTRDFVESVASYYEKTGRLSEKQENAIDKIITRYKNEEAKGKRWVPIRIYGNTFGIRDTKTGADFIVGQEYMADGEADARNKKEYSKIPDTLEGIQREMAALAQVRAKPFAGGESSSSRQQARINIDGMMADLANAAKKLRGEHYVEEKISELTPLTPENDPRNAKIEPTKPSFPQINQAARDRNNKRIVPDNTQEMDEQIKDLEDSIKLYPSFGTDYRTHNIRAGLEERLHALRMARNKLQPPTVQASLDMSKQQAQTASPQSRGLVPKEVPIHMPSGRVVEGIRWVRPGEGEKFTRGKVRLPPGWTDVWVSEDPKSEMQATGFDSKGRRQYLYSTKHGQKASAAKFKRIKDFTSSVNRITRQIEKDFHRSEEARVLYLINKTAFRIGSETDTKAEQKAYGASTLLGKHVKIAGDMVEFDFIGKKGVRIHKIVEDAQLAKFLERRKKGPETPLFKTTGDEVRKYLHEVAGQYKIKDFRTYHGTSRAIEIIKAFNVPTTKKQFKEFRKQVAEQVSDFLGNTPAVALSAYINPAVFSPWIAALAERGITIEKQEIPQPIRPFNNINEMLESVIYDEEESWEDTLETEYDPDDSEEENNYEAYTNFGGGYYYRFIREHPEYDNEKFQEYVVVHNKADRDSGELGDIASEEIDRLVQEFRENNITHNDTIEHMAKSLAVDFRSEIVDCLMNLNLLTVPSIDQIQYFRKALDEWKNENMQIYKAVLERELTKSFLAGCESEGSNPDVAGIIKEEGRIENAISVLCDDTTQKFAELAKERINDQYTLFLKFENTIATGQDRILQAFREETEKMYGFGRILG